MSVCFFYILHHHRLFDQKLFLGCASSLHFLLIAPERRRARRRRSRRGRHTLSVRYPKCQVQHHWSCSCPPECHTLSGDQVRNGSNLVRKGRTQWSTMSIMQRKQEKRDKDQRSLDETLDVEETRQLDRTSVGFSKVSMHFP